MGEAIDDMRALRDHNKAVRRRFGVNCPRCIERRPRATPSLLLPQQRCRIDGYFDQRPELTSADHQSVADDAGGAHG